MSTSSAIVQNSYSYLMTYQNHSEEVFSDAINTENVVFVSGTLPAAAVCPHVHLYFVLLQMLLSLTLRLKKKKKVCVESVQADTWKTGPRRELEFRHQHELASTPEAEGDRKKCKEWTHLHMELLLQSVGL